jgi:hypothetical protein
MTGGEESPPLTEVARHLTAYYRARLGVRLADGTPWAMQAKMAELYQTAVHTVKVHVKRAYDGRGLKEDRTIRNCRMVRSECGRQVKRKLLPRPKTEKHE